MNLAITQQLQAQTSLPFTQATPDPVAPFEQQRQAAISSQEKTAEQAREAARQFVASTFFSPMFAQIRNSPFKSEMFHGGMAEDAFNQQLDTILADRMVENMDTAGNGFSLVDAVYQQIMKQATPNQGVDTHG